jgi:hypothetical protein
VHWTKLQALEKNVAKTMGLCYEPMTAIPFESAKNGRNFLKKNLDFCFLHSKEINPYFNNMTKLNSQKKNFTKCL